jgi:hypothetical protein
MSLAMINQQNTSLDQPLVVVITDNLVPDRANVAVVRLQSRKEGRAKLNPAAIQNCKQF